MDDAQPLQVFVRNDQGNIWGPLAPATVELLIDNGVIAGRVQLSLNGRDYVFPGRLPNVRMYVPKELWGDVVVPGDDLDHPAPVPPVPGGPTGGAAPPAGPGGIRAGPGAMAVAASRSVAAMAGPGARAAMDRRYAPNIGQPVQRPAPSAPVRAPDATASPAPSAPGRAAGPTGASGGNAPASSRPTTPAASQAGISQPAAPAAVQAVAPPRPASAAVGPSLDGIVPPRGDLSALSVIHLYYLLASQDRTGLLSLQLSDRKIDIHFRKGNPERVDSSHPDDALATSLVRAGLANFEQLGRAEAQKANFGGELIGALFGLGVLQPQTAFTHLATRANSILLRAFGSEVGAFTFEPVELPAERAMPLGNRWLVLAEQCRRIPIAEVRRRMTDCADNPVMKSGGRVGFDQLRLTPHEARALASFDGVRSLAQLAAAHPAEADHLFRVAWMLKDLEMVSFAAVKLPPPSQEPEPLIDATVEPLVEASVDPEPVPPPVVAAAPKAPPPTASPVGGVAPRPPPTSSGSAPSAGPGSAPRPGPTLSSNAPARPPSASTARPGAAPVVGPPSAPASLRPAVAAAPSAAAGPRPLAAPVASTTTAAPSAAAANVEGDIRQLQELFKKMKGQNHFEILGLTPKAEPGAIKIAYFKMAKQFHPDTVPPGAPEALAKAKADVFARIGEANRTLSDERLRTEYIAELEAGGGGEKIDVAALLAAEEMFQKGMILVKARKFADAVKMLDEAIKANPEEGEFYSYRGYAKFFLNPDKKVSYIEAMKDIHICIKRNERCASVWFHQGMMAKLLGDNFGAKKHFQKTVQLQPDHIDAQRELRLMK